MQNINCRYNIKGSCNNSSRRFFFGLFQKKYCDKAIYNPCRLGIPYTRPKLNKEEK